MILNYIRFGWYEVRVCVNKWLVRIFRLRFCERCYAVSGVEEVSSMTQYARSFGAKTEWHERLTGKNKETEARIFAVQYGRPHNDTDLYEDPNRDLSLCGECAAEHIEYWNDMWAEYRSMVM